jgi:hypothetical protein
MIENLNPHQLPDLQQPGRDLDIIRARRRILGRMVVHQDQVGALEDLTGVT